jgi:hypothetical protein
MAYDGGSAPAGEYKVKGSTLLSKIKFVHDQLGVEAEKRLLSELSAQEFPPIFESGWVPFKRYEELLGIIVELFLDGDVRRLVEVGEYSARNAFGSTYKSWIHNKDIIGFLKWIDRLHRTLYSHGHIEVVIAEGERGCKILHRGKPRYCEADLYVALGFYQGATRLLGHRSTSGTYEHDPEGVTFTITW